MDEPAIGLDGEDFALLDQFLSANAEQHDGLGLDGAHGLITAVLVGPVALSSEQWLPVIFGDRPLTDPDPALQTARVLLERLYQSTRAAIEQFMFEPVLAHVLGDDDEDTEVDSSGWCEGFSLGVDLCGARWEQQMRQDPRLLALLGPIIVLGVDDGAFTELARDPDIAPLSEREREELRQRLPGAVLDCWMYWRDHAEDHALEPLLQFEPEDVRDPDPGEALARRQRLH